MTGIPKTQYAKTSVGRIAYQVIGDGPIDLLVTHPPHFPIDHMWDEPRLVQFLDGLSKFSRHIWFDPRGRGASDRVPPADDLLQETVVEDMTGLLDALHLDQVAILGLGGGVVPLFAAGHPERTKAVVLVNVLSWLVQADDEAHVVSPEMLDLVEEWNKRYWGTEDEEATLNAPGLADDSGFKSWFAKAQRLTCPADDTSARLRALMSLDQRSVLGAITVPTMILARPASPLIGGEVGPYLASHIRGATYLELEGKDSMFFVGDTGPMLDAIEEFLTGELPSHDIDRVLATVMFTDIVGSTDHLARVGDRTWKATLTAHDTLVGREIERHRGRQIKSTGDGVLATFDGPGRAVRCAQSVAAAVRSLGIEVRAGVHTGEIELRGEDVGGIGVHIAARVASLARPSEVLVSRTVTDLVAGSGIEFEDRGEQKLKGVPGNWRLYSSRP